MVMANVFRKLRTVKSLVRTLSKKPRFRTRFDSQNVKASEMHGKCPYEHFYHFFLSFSGKVIWKMSPIV